MNVFEQNIQFLKKKFPELVEIINERSEFSDYDVVSTKKDEPNLNIKHEGKHLSLHSKYNAQSEAVKWISTVQENTNDMEQLLVFGAGLGYFLEAVLQHAEVKQIIYYEPDAHIFNQMVRLRDIRSILSDQRIQMVAVGGHEYVSIELAHYVSTRMLGSLSVIAPPIYQRMYGDTLQQLKVQIQDAVMKEASNQQTHDKFNKQWLQNILFNLPYTINWPSLRFLKDKWKGTKTIIVGSGPSLEKDVHYLKSLKGKCFIIAAGSSVQALQNFGIDPDLVIAMDGGIANYFVFKKIDTSRSPILFINQLHHEILNIYKGQMIFSRFQNDSVSEYLLLDAQNVPCFRPTASVTGTALQVAAFLGSNEIILMGQDLSYPNNQFYSSGVNHLPETIKQRTLARANEWVANVDGGVNLTSAIMSIVRQNTEMNIKALALEGVRVINTSKGGAVIEGSEWMAMEELIIGLEHLAVMDFDIQNKINNQLPSNYKEQYAITINKVKLLIRQVESVNKKLAKIATCIQNLDSSCNIRNSKQVNLKLVEVNELWKWITVQDSFTVLYSFALSQHINKYMKFVPRIVETMDPFEKAKLIVQHLGELIEEILDFSPELESILIQSMHRLEKFNAKINGGTLSE